MGGGGAAGSTADVATLLKPALARGLRCVGATTHAELRPMAKADPALVRRFMQFTVPELDRSAAVSVCGGCCTRMWHREF